MVKHEVFEARARIGIYDGILRARVPAPIVERLGGRKGDYLVFSKDKKGNVILSITRAYSQKGSKKKS
jgi:hypothetical protein